MGAANCQRCAAPGKTYWVNDAIWLCAKCFKTEKAPKPEHDYVAMHNENFAKLDPLLAADAINYLRQVITTSEKVSIQGEMAANAQTWWAPYHMTWGMHVRNMLRAEGFGEDAFHIDNIDDFYVALVERAVVA
jgi:hypothetical protein